MSSPRTHPPRLVPPAGRRRQPRLDAEGVLHGYSVRLNRPVQIREVSLHGFSARSAVPFVPGATESFHFTSVDGHSTFITARAVHCQQVPSSGPQPAYVAGFAFLPQSFEALQVFVHVPAGHDGPGTGSSRRRTPRFEVTADLHVQLDDGTVPVLLRDIGLGGFGLESACAFPAGNRYQARFTDSEGLDVTIPAEAVHSRRAADHEQGDRWMTGFTYIIDHTAVAEAVEAVLDRATSCLSFI